MHFMESSNVNSDAREERCDLTDFFDDLIEAEAGVFRLSDWGHHSVIYSRHSPQHVRALQENGCGLQILRHGRCAEDIHNYFRNYESYKCCLGLVGGQNIRTRLRLVKSDSLSQTSLDIGVDVTATAFSYAAQVDFRLSDEEYRAFKCALWCAICPLLTAQKPPDDSSPPSTPSEQRRDLEIQHHRKLPQRKSRHYSASTTHSSSGDGSLISSDIMREVLRRAFGLDKHLEVYYLKLGYKLHKTRNDAQILAEDMCYQLSLLEKDAHPYYKSSSFLSQSAYSLWRLSKRRHIMELMSKFWCNALPPVGDVDKFDAHNIHSDYRLLLHKLLRQQKMQYCKDPGTVTFAVVPSGATHKILMEFSLRYGIDDLYHLATYLEYLMLNFEIEKEFIDLVAETVQNILSFLPVEKTTALLVRRQVEQLESCIGLVLRRCEHLFSHIQTMFVSTNSCGSIGSLIHLLEKTVMLRDYLGVAAADVSTTPGQLLQSYLEVNFQLMYVEHRTSALSDASNRGEQCQLSPRVVNRIMFCLRDDLADYHGNYQSVFERYFNISELSSIALYEFLMKDVLELCQQMRTQNETLKVNFGMIGLIYRLNTFDNDLKEFIAADRQTWRQACMDLVMRWFSALYRKGEYFILRAVAQDQFIPLHISNKLMASEDGTRCFAESSSSPQQLLQSKASAFSVVTCSAHKETSEAQNGVTAGQRAVALESSQSLSSHVHVPDVKVSSLCEADGSYGNGVDLSRATGKRDNICIENDNSGNSNSAVDCKTVETDILLTFETQISGKDADFSIADDHQVDSGCVQDLSEKSVCVADGISGKSFRGDHTSDSKMASVDGKSNALVISQSKSVVADVLQPSRTVPSTLLSNGENISIPDGGEINSSDVVESPVFVKGGSDVEAVAESSNVSAMASVVSKDGNGTDEICSDVCIVATHPVEVDSTSDSVVVASSHPDSQHLSQSDEFSGGNDQSSVLGLQSVGEKDLVETVAGYISEQPDLGEVRLLDAQAQSDVTEEQLGGDPQRKQQLESTSQSGLEVNSLDAVCSSDASNLDHLHYVQEQSTVPDVKKMASDAVCSPDVSDDSLSSESTGSAKSDDEDNDGARSSSCNSRSNDGDTLPRLKLVGYLRESENSEAATTSDTISVPRPAHLLKLNDPDPQNTVLKPSSPDLPGESLDRLSPVAETRDQPGFDSAARVSSRSDSIDRAVILVTSSLVDVVCLLQRLICVTETLGTALYSPASASRDSCIDDDSAEYKMDELWIHLKKYLEKMIHDLAILYARNFLAMDLCAVSQKIATELTGNQLVEDLIKSRNSIWGCRHKLSGSDCLRYVNRHEEFRGAQHEPLSKDMCFRINNLLQLRKMLAAFFQKSAFHNITNTTSSLTITEEYLDATITALINIFVYRMQLFIIDFLTQLVLFQLPSRVELETTLQPLTLFLTGHLRSIQDWLCPENYAAVLDRLWLSLSWCFEKCTQDVIRNPSSESDQYADRLLQTIVIVMRLIVKLNLTSPGDIKVNHLDAVLFWLQLYSQSTRHLISIYQLLCLKKDVLGCETPLPCGCDVGTFEKMRRDLHSSRKCFQGQQLIDWITRHSRAFVVTNSRSRQSLDDIVGESDGSIVSEIHNAACHSPYDLAQAFLDTGAVQPLDFSSSSCCSSSVTSDPYPRLVFHGRVKQTEEASSVDSNKTITPPAGSSQVPQSMWFGAETQAPRKELVEPNGDDVESKLADVVDLSYSRRCNLDAEKTADNEGTDPKDRYLNGSDDDACPTSQTSREGPSEMVGELSSDSSPTNVPANSHTFYSTGWYKIPSPSETFTMTDPVEAMSQGRLQEVQQCLQFFIAKRVRKEAVLSIIASRKKRDDLAKQFVQSLPRNVVSKYPWLYVKEQTVLACLGLLA